MVGPPRVDTMSNLACAFWRNPPHGPRDLTPRLQLRTSLSRLRFSAAQGRLGLSQLSDSPVPLSTSNERGRAISHDDSQKINTLNK